MSGDDEAGTATAQTTSGREIGGRYLLRTKLGSGSMGVVWAGYDSLLRRPVAVKEVRLPPGMPDDEAQNLRERTLREARAIAALSHPNVITVYDVVQQDGAPFVVMELMVGSSLAGILRSRGVLSLTQSAAVADAVAAGLEAAHRVGITHRDVKPGNVLVGEDDQIKLTDFGIARNVSDKTMTQSGVILGSPAFMAPEVAAGKPVTAAADLWGLGATLFAAACGRAPYDVNGDVLATLTKVVQGEVPEPDCAGELAPVIRALMVKDPRGRTGLVEVRRAIYRLLPEPGVRVFPVAERPIELLPEEVEPEIPPAAPSTVDEPSDGAPLAADPGPLPFLSGEGRAESTLGDPAEETYRPYQPPAYGPHGAGNQLPEEPWHPTVNPRPRHRGPLATAALIVISVLLFGCAAGGGFVAARKLAGQPLRAEHNEALFPSYAAADVRPPLQRIQGNASTVSGDDGGVFSIRAPKRWTMFLTQRTVGDLPRSAVAHYVSADGSRDISVERIPGCYPDHSIKDFTSAVPGRSTPQPYRVRVRGLRADTAGPQPSEQVLYRTDGGSGSNANYAYLYPSGDDLWVVTLSVPVQQETGARSFFAEVADSFTVLD